MDTVEEKDVKSSPTSQAADPETIDLYDILILLVRRRRMIGVATSVALLVGLALCLLLKPYFTATAVILPPQQATSSAALLGQQLGSLANLGATGSVLALKSPGDLYVGILGSRTIADAIISQFHLENVYKQKKEEDTRSALKNHTVLESGKDGLIYISVTDNDPRRASDIANGYVDQLYARNSELAISDAAQRRVFFEGQLDAEKKSLAAAEDDLRATEQKTGMIQVTGQAQAIIQSIAQLRAQIASREVELQALKVSSTEQNSDVIRLQEEIMTMRAQLAKLENSQKQVEPSGELAESAGSVPQGSLEFARKYREVQYHETLYGLLTRQYEAARIDEAKSAPVIQIVDHAVPPDRKAGPKRALILAMCLLVGLVGACLWAFLAHSFVSTREAPETARKLASIRSLLREKA
ncbi:MAG TPA: Wzz/FepE/Etk N-terminal domain-containing protein [Acidobacteriaceae bacterium]|jgi:uncharacterized protein involved in exopolysaccharide biosynthesis